VGLEVNSGELRKVKGGKLENVIAYAEQSGIVRRIATFR